MIPAAVPDDCLLMMKAMEKHLPYKIRSLASKQSECLTATLARG